MTAIPKTKLEQPAPETEATHQYPVLRVVSELISDIGSKIAVELTRAEQSQAARLQETLADLRDSIRRELSESLRQEFEARFRESMEMAKQQFTQRLQEASTRLEEERMQFHEEIATARRRTLRFGVGGRACGGGLVGSGGKRWEAGRVVRGE